MRKLVAGFLVLLVVLVASSMIVQAKTTMEYIVYEPCSTGYAFQFITYDDAGNFVSASIICEEYFA